MAWKLVIRTFKIQLKPEGEVSDHHVTDTIVTAWWPSPDGPKYQEVDQQLKSVRPEQGYSLLI